MPNSIASFIKDVELLDIFLKSTTSDCSVFPTSVDPSKLDLQFKYDIQTEHVKANKVVLCFISLEAKALGLGGGEQQFYISAQYVLAYSYKNFTGEVSVELFDEFSRRNALFNAYPFLRETILNISTKMALPAVIAPLLRPGSKIVKSAPKVEDNKDLKAKATKKTKKAKKS